MTVFRIALISLFVMVANSAFAARPDFNYVGGGLAFQSLKDDRSCTQDGLFVEGSLSLDGQMFFQAKHVDAPSNDWQCGSSTPEISVGLRNNYGLSSIIYAKGSLIYRDYGNDADAGIAITLGSRSMISDQLELGGSFAFEKVDERDQFYITASGNYSVAPKFSITGEVSLNNHGSTGLSTGVRYTF